MRQVLLHQLQVLLTDTLIVSLSFPRRNPLSIFVFRRVGAPFDEVSVFLVLSSGSVVILYFTVAVGLVEAPIWRCRCRSCV